MIDLQTILLGISDVFTLSSLLAILCGIIIGQFVGALPGVGPVMVMAIFIPYTLVFSPLTGIAFLIGAMKGGTIGGAIPAILVNTPGTPDAAITALDGYPMAKKGKSIKAMKMAVYSSVTGDVFSDIVLITVSAPLAYFALKMGPVEIFSLMILAFAIISALSGDSISKGIIAAALGLFLSTIGMDPEEGMPRMYFGFFELFDGLPLEAVAIGMLVLSEVVMRMAKMTRSTQPMVEIPKDRSSPDSILSFKEYWACRFVIARGAAIGTFIGALPGIGSAAAAFMSYSTTKQAAKDPEAFGKGDIRGVAAAESANSAVSGANLIPLLMLGIPGSVTAALVLSALMVHGVQPGPLIFENQSRLIYGIFGTMIIANAVNFCLGLLGWRLWARLARAPESIILSTAILLCIVGASVIADGNFGITIMFIAAVVGVLMRAFGYPIIVFVIAFFLGTTFERSFGQTLALLNGNWANIINFPIAVALLICALLFILNQLRKHRKMQGMQKTGA